MNIVAVKNYTPVCDESAKSSIVIQRLVPWICWPKKNVEVLLKLQTRWSVEWKNYDTLMIWLDTQCSMDKDTELVVTVMEGAEKSAAVYTYSMLEKSAVLTS